MRQTLCDERLALATIQRASLLLGLELPAELLDVLAIDAVVWRQLGRKREHVASAPVRADIPGDTAAAVDEEPQILRLRRTGADFGPHSVAVLPLGLNVIPSFPGVRVRLVHGAQRVLVEPPFNLCRRPVHEPSHRSREDLATELIEVLPEAADGVFIVEAKAGRAHQWVSSH